MSEPHAVYPGGPLCQPNCPGPWSSYHDGYADGYSLAEHAERARIAEGVRGLDGWFSRRASCCSWSIGAHYNRDGTVGGDLVPPHEPTIVEEKHGGLIARAAVLAIVEGKP